MRMRKKKNLDLRLSRQSHLMEDDPFSLRGQWKNSRLPLAGGLRVELGCGKGRFVCENALANPDILFVAVERVPEALVMAMEKAAAYSLNNVRFISGDAVNIQDIFAPGEVDLIYINFCDPWPSNKRAKRRLTHRSFLTLYKNVLKSGGGIHFKTDNLELFRFSLDEFASSGFKNENVTFNLHENGKTGVMTEYEEKFTAQGVKINRCEAYLV